MYVTSAGLRLYAKDWMQISQRANLAIGPEPGDLFLRKKGCAIWDTFSWTQLVWQKHDCCWALLSEFLQVGKQLMQPTPTPTLVSAGAKTHQACCLLKVERAFPGLAYVLHQRLPKCTVTTCYQEFVEQQLALDLHKVFWRKRCYACGCNQNINKMWVWFAAGLRREE